MGGSCAWPSTTPPSPRGHHLLARGPDQAIDSSGSPPDLLPDDLGALQADGGQGEPQLTVEPVADAVLDFGMSKTVVARADQACLLAPDHFAASFASPQPALPRGWVLVEAPEALVPAAVEVTPETSGTGPTPDGHPGSDSPDVQILPPDESGSELPTADSVEPEAGGSQGGSEVSAATASPEPVAGLEPSGLAAEPLPGPEPAHITVPGGTDAGSSVGEPPSADLVPDIRDGQSVGLATGSPEGAAVTSWASVIRPLPPFRTVSVGQDERAFASALLASVREGGVELDTADILHAYLSLKQSAFLLVSGPPGVGKSTLAARLLAALGLSTQERTLFRVAVEAAWTGPGYLLGADAIGGFEPSAFAEAAWLAHSHRDRLIGVVLEECNLAQLDYYLAPMLVAMDGEATLRLPPGASGEPRHLDLPVAAPLHRLLVVGTMNVDEAGTALTDKVLDRAAIVDLGPPEVGESVPAIVSPTGSVGAVSAECWARLCATASPVQVPSEIKSLAGRLIGEANGRYALGRRVIRQTCVYLAHAKALGDNGPASLPWEDALDFQVLTRVLPRLRGDAGVRPALDVVEKFAAENGLRRTRRRSRRMLDHLHEHHSTDFWAG